MYLHDCKFQCANTKTFALVARERDVTKVSTSSVSGNDKATVAHNVEVVIEGVNYSILLLSVRLNHAKKRCTRWSYFFSWFNIGRMMQIYIGIGKEDNTDLSESCCISE